MPELDLRSRSSTELVDAAFQVFRRDPMQFMLAAAAVYVPWLVIRLVFDLGVGPDTLNMSRLLITAVIGMMVYAIGGGAITLLARDVYLGTPLDITGAFRMVARRVRPLLVSSVITFALIAVGAMLFLIPALYPLARFFAVRQAVMIEGTGIGEALNRSSELSVDLKRHILNTILLVGLLSFAVSAGAGMIIGLIPSRVIVAVISTAISVVIYPFFGITETLLYYDVRIRKEGFDVEYLARAGGGGGAAGAELPNVAI